LGRRYEAKISSPVAERLMVWEREGDVGRGGSFVETTKLLDDLLFFTVVGEARKPSFVVGEAGGFVSLSLSACLVVAPRSRALLMIC